MNTRDIPLSHDRTMVDFFDKASLLGPGETVTLRASLPGAMGKKELQGVRSWMLHERRRRKREAMDSMVMDGDLDLEALENADPLRCVGTIMEENPRGTWTLVAFCHGFQEG